MKTVRGKNKYRQTKGVAVHANNLLTQAKRKAITDALELIDFNVSTEFDRLRKTLPILEDYLLRGKALLIESEKRVLEHSARE